MTFSILARDPKTGAIGGAAATGSYCVGGWVLRGRWDVGMSASQGASPSVYWGEDVLAMIQNGQSPQSAVDEIVEADEGRAHRQLSALDMKGNRGVFSGKSNIELISETQFDNGVACGNMLKTATIGEAMANAMQLEMPFAEQLLKALEAGERQGGDIRGLKSAALLVFYPDAPPLSLRIDDHDHPIQALSTLYTKTQSGAYFDWLPNVPNPQDKARFPK